METRFAVGSVHQYIGDPFSGSIQYEPGELYMVDSHKNNGPVFKRLLTLNVAHGRYRGFDGGERLTGKWKTLDRWLISLVNKEGTPQLVEGRYYAIKDDGDYDNGFRVYDPRNWGRTTYSWEKEFFKVVTPGPIRKYVTNIVFKEGSTRISKEFEKVSSYLSKHIYNGADPVVDARANLRYYIKHYKVKLAYHKKEKVSKEIKKMISEAYPGIDLYALPHMADLFGSSFNGERNVRQYKDYIFNANTSLKELVKSQSQEIAIEGQREIFKSAIESKVLEKVEIKGKKIIVHTGPFMYRCKSTKELSYLGRLTMDFSKCAIDSCGGLHITSKSYLSEEFAHPHFYEGTCSRRCLAEYTDTFFKLYSEGRFAELTLLCLQIMSTAVTDDHRRWKGAMLSRAITDPNMMEVIDGSFERSYEEVKPKKKRRKVVKK